MDHASADASDTRNASALDRGDHLNAHDLITDQFAKQFRGYDTDEVDTFFEQLRLSAIE